MIINNKIALSLLLGSMVPLVGKQEPHITESEICKKIMSDHARVSLADKTWVDTKRNQIAAAEEKYTALGDAQKLEKLNELKKCMTFLQKFPSYQAAIEQTKKIFAVIDPKNIPDAAVIEKVNDKFKRKEVTQEEAWKLFKSKPCQDVYYSFYCDLSKEKIEDLKKAAFSLMTHKRTELVHVSSDPLNATKEVPLTAEKMVPEDISQKAAILYACLIIIEQKAEAYQLANGIESYLEESKKI